MSRTLIALVSLVVAMAAGCATAPARSAAPVRTASHPMSAVSAAPRTTFVASLSALRTLSAAVGDGFSPDTGATGSLKLVIRDDNSLEFQLIVFDAKSVTYVSAQLVRVRREEGAGETVATLFADVALSGRYAQLRGTGLVDATLDPDSLAAELREHPSEFVVRVVPRAGHVGELRGTLR